MLVYLHIAIILCGVDAVERRDRSLASTLVRYVLQRSDYNTGENEYSRVTQSPMLKIHLRKTFLPTTFHSSLKSGIGEQLLERAAAVDQMNEQKKAPLMETITLLDEVERLSGQPLNRLLSHNYKEREFKASFPVESESRAKYSQMMNNPIGLSDYAALSSGPPTNQTNEYAVLERQRLKPSEMEMEDTERSHMPIFAERGDVLIKSS
ncbi:hypothetical protein BgAZ_306050 [Babesia gibsoni]|uniref:Uncharacterized protein n=1 Tax=Babesia gibsoni TaxID=33632 RepID=A0AAD8PE27_BABGI|nr:hypothetical protein BgAZ_306050 [Babesia gibsoni]